MKPDRKRAARIAAGIGVALALLCPELAPKYQAPCNAVVAICGGFIP